MENKLHLLAAMFFDKSLFREQSWYRVTKETFLPSYIEIGPVVSDKKSFLYRYIGKISPTPWGPCFLTNHDSLNNLDRGLHKKHSCNVIFKSVQWFLTRRSLNFQYRYIGKISPTPSSHIFWQIMTVWTSLVKGHQGNMSAKLRGMFEMNCLFQSGDFKFQVSPKVLISCPRSTPRG